MIIQLYWGQISKHCILMLMTFVDIYLCFWLYQVFQPFASALFSEKVMPYFIQTDEPIFCYGLHPRGWWYVSNSYMEVVGQIWKYFLVIGAICVFVVVTSVNCS